MSGTVGTAPGTTTVTLDNGVTIAFGDWIDDQLYSTIQFGNGDTSQIEAFISARSQPIPGGFRKTNSTDTNQPRNGNTGLPKDWEMLIYGWGIEIVRAMRPATGEDQPRFADTGGALSDPPTLRTWFDINRTVAFTFVYNAKTYTFGVPEDYPAGHGFSTFSTNAAFEYVNNGVPSPRDRRALVIPVHMRENLSYTAIYKPEAALIIDQPASDGGDDLTFVDIKTYLYGLIKRTVV